MRSKLARDVLLARLGELTGLDLSKPAPRVGSKQIQVKRDFSQPVQNYRTGWHAYSKTRIVKTPEYRGT